MSKTITNTKAANTLIQNVENRVNDLMEHGGIQLPANYSVANALRFAHLILQQTEDRNKRPVLEVCTPNSIANSLLSMVVQGLDPNRRQVYFIPYGDQLTAQRSYFGEVALAKRFAGVQDVHAQLIYKGDDFQTSISPLGVETITKHVRAFGSSDGDIVGAYAVVVFTDPEREPQTTVMTMAEIEKSWLKGANNNPARRDFPGEMAKRTVTRRAVKGLINSSDDSHLGLIEDVILATRVDDSTERVAIEAAETSQKVLELDEEPASEAPDEELEGTVVTTAPPEGEPEAVPVQKPTPPATEEQMFEADF